MATHTVYGCRNLDTGVITFDDTYTGCEDVTITGCRVNDPADPNFRKIKITHDYAGCSDTYYACYDPDTGEFSYEADDSCCDYGDWAPGTCCGGTLVPRFLSITPYGFTNCGDCQSAADHCNCADLNGIAYIVDFFECVNNYYLIGDHVCGGSAPPLDKIHLQWGHGQDTTFFTVRIGWTKNTPSIEWCFLGSTTVNNVDGDGCQSFPVTVNNTNNWCASTCHKNKNDNGYVVIDIA